MHENRENGGQQRKGFWNKYKQKSSAGFRRSL